MRWSEIVFFTIVATICAMIGYYINWEPTAPVKLEISLQDEAKCYEMFIQYPEAFEDIIPLVLADDKISPHEFFMVAKLYYALRIHESKLVLADKGIYALPIRAWTLREYENRWLNKEGYE